MRTAARVDGNQADIVKALRKAGASVQVLSSVGKGCPDLLVGHRGVNLLMEVKDESQKPADQRLTRDEVKWHMGWKGDVLVVRSPEDAVGWLKNYELQLTHRRL